MTLRIASGLQQIWIVLVITLLNTLVGLLASVEKETHKVFGIYLAVNVISAPIIR